MKMAVRFSMFLAILYFVVMTHCVDFIPERLCGILYSNGDEEPFKMKDFDQAVDLRRDYRASVTGWTNTTMVRVKSGCKMHLCNESYFRGTCNLFTENISLPNAFISQAISANCTCSRDCNCEDVVLSKQEFGRAYLKGGCGTCDADYISLQGYHRWFDDEVVNSVETIKIQRGCNLTISESHMFTGNVTVFNTEISENFHGNIGISRIQCNKSANFLTRKQFQQEENSQDIPIVNLPNLPEALMGMISSGHPGVLAALNSLENGRSWRNAYILIIGNNDPTRVFGINGCLQFEHLNIRECRIPVNLNYLGITNSELRIIYYDSLFNDFNNDNEPWVKSEISMDKDYRLMASLDSFLSNHEELNESIPNAVIIFNRIYDTNGDSVLDRSDYAKLFKRILKVVNATRSKIFDEDYSNIILHLENHFFTETRTHEQMELLEKEIGEKWKFPKPVTILMKAASCTIKYVNGFCKDVNGEYFPMNIRDNLVRICKNAGDTLGQEIIKQAYLQSSANITFKTIELVPSNHSKVRMYRDTDGQVIRVTSSSDNGRNLRQERIQNGRIQALENRLAEQEKNLETTVERVKTEIWEKIKVDLNKLFE